MQSSTKVITRLIVCGPWIEARRSNVSIALSQPARPSRAASARSRRAAACVSTAPTPRASGGCSAIGSSVVLQVRAGGAVHRMRPAAGQSSAPALRMVSASRVVRPAIARSTAARSSASIASRTLPASGSSAVRGIVRYSGRHFGAGTISGSSGRNSSREKRSGRAGRI
jgi:hypothetical protein